MWVLIGLYALACAVGVSMMRRNNLVCEYRKDLVNRAYQAGLLDIAAGGDGLWRYARFERVTYEQMLYQFWRPFSSFYPDEQEFAPRLLPASPVVVNPTQGIARLN